MKKKPKISLRPLYDKRYKEIEVFFASSCYKKGLSEVSEHFKKHGLPLPKNPIEPDKCLFKPGPGSTENIKKHKETSNSSELKEGLRQLEKEYRSGKITRKIFGDLRHRFETSKVLLPVGEYINYLLRECAGLYVFRDKEKGNIFYNQVIDRIFHGNKEYISPFTIYTKGDDGYDEPYNLYIKISPTTTRDDIIKNWNFIKMSQKRLPGYKENLRKKIFFNKNDILKKTKHDDETCFYIKILPTLRKKNIVENGSFIKERQQKLLGYQNNYRSLKNIKRDTYIKELYLKLLKENNFKTKEDLWAKILNKLEVEGYDEISFRRIQEVVEN